MTIPMLSEVFSNTGHSLEEHQFSAVCPRCSQMCGMGEIQSVQKEGERTYHCLCCMSVVVVVSDPATTPESAEFYRIAGWALRPLATLSIALEVSAITVPPLRSGARKAQFPNHSRGEWHFARAYA